MQVFSRFMNEIQDVIYKRRSGVFDNEEGIHYLAEYYFGNFCLKFNEVLLKNGRVISVPPKELHILSLLVVHAGRLVSKEFLIKKVWNGGVVSDESLTRCIYSLRKILEKSGDTSCHIETIYGKGYVFISETSLASDIQYNAKDMLVVFPCGKCSDLPFIDIYEMFSECLPQDVNIYPYALLSKCQGSIDSDNFIKNHHPKYVVYYTLTDVGHNEKIINFSIENRVDNEQAIWLTLDLSQLKDRNYFYFKHRLQQYFNRDVFHKHGTDPSERKDATERAYLHQSLVNYLIDDYSHSSLTTAINVLLKNANSRAHYVDSVIKLAECYLGFILSGDNNIYKLIYKVKKMVESLLQNEPLNPKALVLMGVVKSIDNNDEDSQHYFSQANFLAPQDDFVTYYYALNFFIKGQYGLFLDETKNLSQSSAFEGRVLFLKHKIQTQQFSNSGYSEKNSHQHSANDMLGEEACDEVCHVFRGDKCNTLRIAQKPLLNSRLNELKEISYHPLRIRNSIDWM